MHISSNFRIYFGDGQDGINPAHPILYGISLLGQEPYASQFRALALDQAMFLKQIHSVQGYCLEQANLDPFITEGDFLVTNQRNIGLGVITADCLPIVLIDQKKGVLATIHAGWRGSVAGIATRAISMMREIHQTNPEDIVCFFGPSIKVCCYQVGGEICDRAKQDHLIAQSLYQKSDGHYFDIPGYNQSLLQEEGLLNGNIISDYNLCTYCTPGYHSYRKGDTYKRQMTLATLI